MNPNQDATTSDASGWAPGSRRLAVLLAAAMFVLVVDTSLMNVSISKVVEDLDTTVSGVQGAIALEALVSAAFILIGSKVGDLIGRKRAFVLGLLGYAIGALAMAFAQGLTAIIVFWAIIGGLGASMLLPAMQSLIHGNFQGAEQKKAYALVGAAAAIAAAVGPLLGGFLTTFLSWRVGFLLRSRRDRGRPQQPQAHQGRAVHRPARGRRRRRRAVGRRHGRRGDRHPRVAGGRGVRRPPDRDRPGRARLARPLARPAASATASRRCSIPDLFKHDLFRLGISSQMLQNIALGGAMIALPIYLQMVLEYNALETGLTIAPLSLTMFATALVAGKRAAKRRPAGVIRAGSALLTVGMLALIPIVPRADSGWALVIPLIVAGAGLGLLVSQLNNYTLSPISDERVSEAAGVNSAAGSFGLSFGLAFSGAIMLATLSIAFTQMAEDSTVLPPAAQEQVAQALEDDAEVMSNTRLAEQLVDEPPEIQAEIIRINTDARPLALQVALLVPILAGLLGLINGFRMMRRPDPIPSDGAEMALA